MLVKIENFISRINTWKSIIDWKDWIVSFAINIISWINGGMIWIIMAITISIVYFGWRIRQYHLANIQPANVIEKIQESDVSLKDAILELNEIENVSSNAILGVNCGLTKDQFIAEYHLMKNLDRHIEGNKITLQTESRNKTKVINDQLPSPRKVNDSRTNSGNKWSNNYTELCSSTGETLYKNLSLKRTTLEKIKEKLANELFEKGETI